ncbi:hypothetical protein [Delftia sp. UGAL515B_04]|uniref:hypothetical protein n=1 Tax=Delftia sp. UGAL515B_04 TaxID=2986766 RepID=UPI002953C72A|nr:hypothetical protein [Delftia sp. UGAL515B_04]WON88680.1 hypothetical protein OK021_28820 [Delftia sp. UGAL515B_04]
MSKTETQSEALRLAAKLRGEAENSIVKYSTAHLAAKELERLDAENKALRERLEIDPSHPIDGIDARDETIRQLEAQVKSAAEAERERICAAIKAEDDYCVTQGDYMLDSDDCIKVARGEWERPVYEVEAAAKTGDAA